MKSKVQKPVIDMSAPAVIGRIIDIAHRNSGLSRGQIEFLRTCLTMLPDSHPHRETLHVMSGGRIGYPKEAAK